MSDQGSGGGKTHRKQRQGLGEKEEDDDDEKKKRGRRNLESEMTINSIIDSQRRRLEMQNRESFHVFVCVTL